jgi:hypothetical protein
VSGVGGNKLGGTNYVGGVGKRVIWWRRLGGVRELDIQYEGEITDELG